MRHYYARQRQDGKWDFVCGSRAVGYCSPYREWTQEELEAVGITKDHPYFQKSAEFKNKHHSCGHDTEKEAQECYKEYNLDQKLSFGESGSVQHKCQMCGEWTQKYAMLDWAMWFLCEKHCNREEVSKLYKAPSDIWCS